MAKGSIYEHKKEEWAVKYNNGMSFSAIAREEGVSKSTVQSVIKDIVIKRTKSPFEQYANTWIHLYVVEAYTITQIASKYGTSHGVVRRMLESHGIDTGRKEGKRKYEHLVSTWITQYENGMSLHEIARTCEASAQTILTYLRETDVEIREYAESSRKYQLDETYFEKIDTDEKAYWLGFFFASGSTLEHLSSWSIQISVSGLHIDRLEAFQEVIQTDKPPLKHKGENCYSLRLNSIHLFNQLRELGLKSNKLQEQVFPSALLPEYYSSFLLGYFDGKGGFYKREFQLAGTKSFLASVSNILITQLGILPKLVPIYKDNEYHYRLKIWKKGDIDKLAEWIYLNKKGYSKIKEYKKN